MRTRGNSLRELISDGVDTVLTGDQHATIKDDAMVYDLTVNGVNRLRFEGFTTFELGEGNDVLDLTVQPRNVGSAWTAAITANGGNGDDVIWSGSGDDTLNGDAGRDRIWGGAGNDTINGGDDADVLRDGDGFDILNGGGGDDELFGGAGNDMLNGEAGADTLRGENDPDILNGGTEADQLFGGAGPDTLDGGDGADILRGEAGNDRINGGADGDIIHGGGDTGRLINTVAVSGNSNITLFTAGDILRGGDGVDTFVYGTGAGVDAIIGFTNDVDRLLVQATMNSGRNNAAFSLDGSNYTANSSTVIALVPTSAGTSTAILVAGITTTQLTRGGTEVIDGITYNVWS